MFFWGAYRMLTFFLSFDLYNCVQKLFSLLVGIKKYFIYCTSLILSKCLPYESSSREREISDIRTWTFSWSWGWQGLRNFSFVCFYHVRFMLCVLHKWQICISPPKIMIMSHNFHYYAKMILSFRFLVTTTQCPPNTKHMGRRMW